MKTTIFILSACSLMLSVGPAVGDVVIKNGESIAYLGDSLTQLGNDHKPNGYLHLVTEGLKAAGVNTVPIPAGIGGHTTVDMLARLDRDVISKKPVWMALNSGINDTPRMEPEEFGANLAKIVDRATTAGIKVILLNTTLAGGENLTSPETLKRLRFCEEFKKLATDRHLILVDLNTAMVKAVTELNKDGSKGLKLTYDGTHLNGLGNQIIAEEILRVLGIPKPTLAALRKHWDDYPFSQGRPTVSVNDYLKLKAAADKNGKTADELISAILTNYAK